MKRGSAMYRSAPQSIKLQDVNNADLAVVTITAVRDVEIEGKKKLALVTKEFGDGRAYYPNLESIDRIVAALGDDDANWLGKQVPLVKTDSEYEGRPIQTLWIAKADEWDSLLGQASGSKRRGK